MCVRLASAGADFRRALSLTYCPCGKKEKSIVFSNPACTSIEMWPGFVLEFLYEENRLLLRAYAFAFILHLRSRSEWVERADGEPIASALHRG